MGADERAKQRAQSLVGKTIDGRYQVDRILAMGGMGTVYLARHLKLKKRVALKALHPDTEDHPELVMRFEREALAGSHVSHPNVASATDFGDLDDGTRYLVTEYVKGETLRATIDREAPFEPTRAVLIARQIAVALAEIHARGIVHRDLKPRNVMLAEGDFVKVVDFGLAKVDATRVSEMPREEAEEDARLTSRGVIFGTVEYLAPEAAFGMELVDARADLYALGVMLFEMLSGKHPFDAKNEVELFAKQRHEKPPSIRFKNPKAHVSVALEEIVQKLLKKDFDERYQDAKSLIAALDEAEPEGSIAPPEPAEPTLSVQSEDIPQSLPPVSETPEPAKEASFSEPDAPERHAVEISARPAWWRTTTAVFVGGAAVALGVIYLAVHHDIESSATPAAPTSASAPPTVESQAPTAESAIAPSAAPTVSASAAPSAPVAAPSQADLAATLHQAVDRVDTAAAAQALSDVLDEAPKALEDASVAKDVALVLKRLAEKPTDQTDDLWKRVALADGGADLLYKFIESGASKSATRAHNLLGSDEVRKVESPALVIAFTLHEAPCNEKLAMVERAVKEGDERSLTGLDIVSKGCVKDPHSIDEPIRRLRDRVRKESTR